MQQYLRREFTVAGYHLEPVGSWQEAFTRLRSRRPDVLIAAASLDDGPVEDRCRQLRLQFPESPLPLLVLGPSSAAEDRERWLEAGADDAITSSFNAREALLRVRSLLRQILAASASRPIICAGLLRLDLEACRVSVGNREIHLTAAEFNFLTELARQGGKVCSREQLLQQLWTRDHSVSVRVVDTLVRRVRRKLGHARGWIRTVRGFGYCLGAPTEIKPSDVS